MWSRVIERTSVSIAPDPIQKQTMHYFGFAGEEAVNVVLIVKPRVMKNNMNLLPLEDLGDLTNCPDSKISNQQLVSPHRQP